MSVTCDDIECRECGMEISVPAKCGALLCRLCCKACRRENGGICPSVDLDKAIKENTRYHESTHPNLK